MADDDEPRLGTAVACTLACELCPDVVEWCTAAGCEDLLAVGTYLHEEPAGGAPARRRGALQLARAPDAAEAALGGTLRWEPLVDLEIPGVYDIDWAPPEVAEGRPAMAVAAADGSLRLLAAASTASGTWELEALAAECQVLEDSILTHVTWGAADACGLAAVGQDGSCTHLQLRPDGSVEVLARRQAHQLETWSVEVSPASPWLVLTGADDAQLQGWDLRECPDAAAALVNRRSHSAGVTALAVAPNNANILATGSYDEEVRLFDLRALARQPLAESGSLGDGAYHIAWHPTESILAIAAMRSGLPLLKASADCGSLGPCGHYAGEAGEGQHGSLAYGISWRRAPCSSPLDWLAASASFYDRSVHLWTVALNPTPATASSARG